MKSKAYLFCRGKVLPCPERVTDPPLQFAFYSSRFTSNGFTLLEVLVAMAIIATALVALLSLQSRSIRMTASAEMLEGARMLSERLMGEGELKGVAGGENKGEEGPYKWILTEMRITPEKMPEGVQALPGRQLSLDVSWKEGDREEKLSFAEYIYEK